MSNQRPNIVFLMTDQHRWDALGCVQSFVQTPNLDRLAARGIRFSQAVCNAPMCVPSRYSMTLGLYPSQCGVRHNTQMIPEDSLLPGPMLPQRLADLGYQTVGLGKTHWYLGNTMPTAAARVVPSHRGFKIKAEAVERDPQAIAPGTIVMAEDDPDSWNLYREEMRQCQCGPESVTGYIGHTSKLEGDRHREGWLTRQAVDFLRHKRDPARPFFLYFSLDFPHAGFNVPPGYEERYRLEDIPLPAEPPWRDDPAGHVETDFRRDSWSALPEEVRRRSVLRYYALCTYVDDCFGRVLRALEEQGGPTFVMFTSDHGEMLGERNHRFTKYCLYESSVRVPLIVAGAGVPSRLEGSVDARHAELVDVLPTLVAVAGGAVPPELPGRSLLDSPCRTGAFAEMHGTGYEVEGGRPGPDWREKKALQAAPSLMWRTLDWKLILHLPGALGDASLRLDAAVGELYDLTRDPREWNNLYEDAAYLSVREKLTRELLLYLACTWARYPYHVARPGAGP